MTAAQKNHSENLKKTPLVFHVVGVDKRDKSFYGKVPSGEIAASPSQTTNRVQTSVFSVSEPLIAADDAASGGHTLTAAVSFRQGASTLQVSEKSFAGRELVSNDLT